MPAPGFALPVPVLPTGAPRHAVRGVNRRALAMLAAEYNKMDPNPTAVPFDHAARPKIPPSSISIIGEEISLRSYSPSPNQAPAGFPFFDDIEDQVVDIDRKYPRESDNDQQVERTYGWRSVVS